MVTIDEAQDILERVAESLPPKFYEELNGGIILLPDVKRGGESWSKDIYTLGEYIVCRSMGRYIAIYYGSFEHVFGRGASEEAIAKELRETLLHEFTHHLEDLAGERGLAKEDERRMRIYKERAALRRIRRG